MIIRVVYRSRVAPMQNVDLETTSDFYKTRF